MISCRSSLENQPVGMISASHQWERTPATSKKRWSSCAMPCEMTWCMPTSALAAMSKVVEHHQFCNMRIQGRKAKGTGKLGNLPGLCSICADIARYVCGSTLRLLGQQPWYSEMTVIIVMIFQGDGLKALGSQCWKELVGNWIAELAIT